MNRSASVPPNRKIRRRKLYEEVADELEALIQSGEFALGEKLPSERDIMERFGVGRSAVREALFAMQKMGLVEVSSGERARVIEPTPAVLVNELAGAARLLLARPEGVRQFQDARALFEIGIARKAALVASGKDIARLEAALAANKAAIGDGPTFMRTDVEFHGTLVSTTGNPIFAALHDALVEWLAEQRSVTAGAGSEPEKVYEDHASIFQAVAAHDPGAAEVAMENHLQYVADYYWKASKQ